MEFTVKINNDTGYNNRSAVISSSDLLVFPSYQETIDISSPLRNNSSIKHLNNEKLQLLNKGPCTL